MGTNPSFHRTCVKSRTAPMDSYVGHINHQGQCITKFLLAGCLIAIPAFAANARFEAKDGVVQNAETAVAIAVAVFKPIYGAEKIENQRPFHAELKGEVWHVYGSLPTGWVGGTAEAELSRMDGRIIRVWHGK